MAKVTKIHNITELDYFARGFVASLISSDRAVVIGLRGELGAGKTAFTKAVAKVLGVELNVTSPTFVLLKKYALLKNNASQVFLNLIHIDAYRLKNAHELEVLGWTELLADSQNLIMIEWPEIVADAMPTYTKYLDFKHIDETTREITEKNEK